MLHLVEKTDIYVQHLINMSQHYSITLSDDVINNMGAVLVPKGGELNQSLVEKIAQHELTQPLRNCVKLNATISTKQLHDEFLSNYATHKNLAKLHNELGLSSLLKNTCEFYGDFPLVMKKLTVLRVQLPSVFEQSLHCAVLSLAIAKKICLSKEECMWACLAGLLHNLGILCLDADMLENKGEYTSQQWRTLQSHPILAHHFLSKVAGLPPSIGNAVLEHHEHCDGSGYPFNKETGELSMMGQIVGMADTCLAIYKRELSRKRFGFDALLPVLQLNPGIYCSRVYMGTVEMIADIDWPKRRVYSDKKMPQVINRLMVENERIHHDYTVLYALLTSISPHMPKNKKTNMLNKMAKRTHEFFVQSGLLKNEHNEWLLISCGAQQQKDYLTIERLEVVYSEVKWQLKQLLKLMCWLWDKKQFSHPKLQVMVKDGLNQIRHYHQKNSLPQVH